MKTILVAAALALSACNNGPCQQRMGTYRWDLTARSGDCGDGMEQIFSTEGEPQNPPPPCTGFISYSDDNCEVTHDESCPVAADGSDNQGTFSVRGVVHWNADGTQANGIFQYDLSSNDASQSCHGTYDATYQKLN